jgi:hypothetical protein
MRNQCLSAIPINHFGFDGQTVRQSQGCTLPPDHGIAIRLQGR